jgi:phage protein D
MQIVCVGATFVLKDRATRVFRDSTVPEAISKIAREYGFNVIADNHPQRFSQLAVTGNSYWEWINEQARRIGYGIIVDGMDFLLKPMDKLIDITFSSAPVLSLGNSSAPFNTDYLDRTLDEFRITYGDNVEDSKEFRTVKNVGGVDPISGKVLLSSSSPADNNDPLREDVSPVLFEEYRTDKVVNDPTAAKETSKAAAQLARFNIPALVKGQGDPRLRPFGAVFISGTGSTTDGFWIAREAHHMFHKIGDYMITMKIATDGVGDAVVETPFRTRDDLAAGTVNLEEAVANGEATRLSFELSEVELITKNQAESEYNQGFTRTPDRWRKVR